MKKARLTKNPQARPTKSPPLWVQAHRLDPKEGAGVAEHAGHRVLVSGLLPGEEAEVEILHKSPHTGMRYAAIRRRLTAATERVVPICPAYGRCGGCTLQHLSYEAQLGWKMERLRQALLEAGLLQREQAPQIHPIVPSPQREYRNRVKLVAYDSGGVLSLGAYAPRSHDLVDTTGCRLVRPALREVTGKLHSLLSSDSCHSPQQLRAYDEGRGEGNLRYVLLRETLSSSAESLIQVSLVAADPAPEQLHALAEKLAQLDPRVKSVVLHENREPGNTLLPHRDVSDQVLVGEPWIWDEGVVPLRISARSFFQVNREVAGLLYDALAQALTDEAAPKGGHRLLDLYCGVAGIGLRVAHRAKQLHLPPVELLGIEENPFAVADAQASSQRFDFTARFLCGDAASILTQSEVRLYKPTLVVLNPPRKGCAPEVLMALVALSPRVLGYVSCDPETLARDLKILEAHGYTVSSLHPFDMHPDTPHIETLAIVKRSSTMESGALAEEPLH